MYTIEAWLILGNVPDEWAVSGRVVVGVVVLLLVFASILRWGKPRQKPSMVISDPPVRDAADPAYIRRRARAAAAAVVLHRKRHANGELDEER